MFGVILLELLSVKAKLFVPLNFWDAFAVVGRVDCVAIVGTVPNVVAFYLATVADVVCRQIAPSALDGGYPTRQPRFHKLKNRVAF